MRWDIAVCVAVTLHVIGVLIWTVPTVIYVAKLEEKKRLEKENQK